MVVALRTLILSGVLALAPIRAPAAFHFCNRQLDPGLRDLAGMQPSTLAVFKIAHLYVPGESVGYLRLVTAQEYRSIAALHGFLPTDILVVSGEFSAEIESPTIAGLFIANQIVSGTHVEDDFTDEARLHDGVFAQLGDFANAWQKLQSLAATELPVRIKSVEGTLQVQTATPEEVTLARKTPAFKDPMISRKKNTVHLKNSTRVTLNQFGQKLFNFAKERNLLDESSSILDTTGFSFGYFFDFLDRSLLPDGTTLSKIRQDLLAVLPRLNAPDAITRLLEAQKQISQAKIDRSFLSEVRLKLLKNYGAGFRDWMFRTSTQNEDRLGSGLYQSIALSGDPAAEIFDFEIERALKVVYGSIYGPKAYFKRRMAALDEANQAMSFFAHPKVEGKYGGNARFYLTGNGIQTIELNIFKDGQTGTNPTPGSFVKSFRVAKDGGRMHIEIPRVNQLPTMIPINTQSVAPLTLSEFEAVVRQPATLLEILDRDYRAPRGRNGSVFNPYGHDFGTEFILTQNIAGENRIVDLQFKPHKTRASVKKSLKPLPVKDLDAEKLQKLLTEADPSGSDGLSLLGGQSFDLKIKQIPAISVFYVLYKGKKYIITTKQHQRTYRALLSTLLKDDPNTHILLSIRVYLSGTDTAGFHVIDWLAIDHATYQIIDVEAEVISENLLIDFFKDLLFQTGAQLAEGATVHSSDDTLQEIFSKMGERFGGQVSRGGWMKVPLSALVRSDLAVVKNEGIAQEFWGEVAKYNATLPNPEDRLLRPDEVWKNDRSSFFWISFRRQTFVVVVTEHDRQLKSLEKFLTEIDPSKPLGQSAVFFQQKVYRKFRNQKNHELTELSFNPDGQHDLTEAQAFSLVREMILNGRTPLARNAEVIFPARLLHWGKTVPLVSILNPSADPIRDAFAKKLALYPGSSYGQGFELYDSTNPKSLTNEAKNLLFIEYLHRSYIVSTSLALPEANAILSQHLNEHGGGFWILFGIRAQAFTSPGGPIFKISVSDYLVFESRNTVTRGDFGDLFNLLITRKAFAFTADGHRDYTSDATLEFAPAQNLLEQGLRQNLNVDDMPLTGPVFISSILMGQLN